MVNRCGARIQDAGVEFEADTFWGLFEGRVIGFLARKEEKKGKNNERRLGGSRT